MMSAPIRIELPTVFGMGSVNAFLFVEPEPVLIDCGEKTEDSWRTLLSAFHENGLKITDLKRLIITHAHVDHMGMAAKVARESGAEVWVNEPTYPWAIDLQKKWDERANLMKGQIDRILPPTGPEREAVMQIFSMFGSMNLFWENIPKEKIKIYPISGSIELGGKDWQIVYTPGHAETQTCFYEPDSKAFIAADMLLKKTPTPVFEIDPENVNDRLKTLPVLLKSFQKVRAMDIETVYPGHYEIFGDPKPLIDKQVNRIHQRKEQVITHVENGISGFHGLFKVMYPGMMHLPGFAMLMGYLDLLELEGRIRIDLKAGRPIVNLL